MFEHQVIVSASSTIPNTEYDFPPDRAVKVVRAVNKSSKSALPTIVVELCKLTFQKYGIVLLFRDVSITFCFETETDYNSWLEPLLEYIIFKSYVKYDAFGWAEIPESELAETPEVQQVLFNLGRIVMKPYRPTGKGTAGFLPEVEPFQLKLEKEDIESFLSLVNPHLQLALSYYLNGSNTTKYFLIEYYKSVEAIKNISIVKEI
jgi:hypothetical protein